MLGKTTAIVVVGACTMCATPAFGARVSDVDMTGVRIRNGFALSRARVGIDLEPAFVYSVHTTGMVIGVGGALGTAFPNPVPIEFAMNELSPGSGERLLVVAGNASGGVGVNAPPFIASGNPVISGLAMEFAMHMTRTVDGAGHAGILISGVVLQPSSQTGFLEFVTGTTRFVARCPGDATEDFSVTFADLNIVLTEFGQTAAPPQSLRAGDVNGDTVVNFGDLNLVLSRFGTSCTP